MSLIAEYPAIVIVKLMAT